MVVTPYDQYYSDSDDDNDNATSSSISMYAYKQYNTMDTNRKQLFHKTFQSLPHT